MPTTPDEHIDALATWAKENHDAVEAYQATAAELHARKRELAELDAALPKAQAAAEAAYKAKINALFTTAHQYDQAIFEKRAELDEVKKSVADAERQLAATEDARVKLDTLLGEITAAQLRWRTMASG
jgi:hypothetical protein